MNTKLNTRIFAMIAALAGIWIFFTIKSPDFIGARNLSMLAIDLSITSTLALGMLLIILTGNIDLSAGSGVGLIGGIASVLIFFHGLPAPLAMLCGLGAALILWPTMGWLVANQKMPSFIITLGGLLVFKGLFWLVINNQTVPVVAGGKSNLYSILTTYYLPPVAGWILVGLASTILIWSKMRQRARRLAQNVPVEDGEMFFLKLFLPVQMLLLFLIIVNQYRGVPLSAIILGFVALVIHLITTQTPFGRHLYAVGGNEEAAHISGLPVQRVVIAAYALMGGVVALTGFLQTAYAGASTTTVGELMELDAVAACVIGGASLKGGRGDVVGVLFGALIMASLLNGMTLMAVPPEIKFIARGLVLALAVWLDIAMSRNRTV
ncbi:MAG: ATPase [Verrucomicrobiae bacterium]|nr:ATPase [Verrucomicrobiae bacterium]